MRLLSIVFLCFGLLVPGASSLQHGKAANKGGIAKAGRRLLHLARGGGGGGGSAVAQKKLPTLRQRLHDRVIVPLQNDLTKSSSSTTTKNGIVVVKDQKRGAAAATLKEDRNNAKVVRYSVWTIAGLAILYYNRQYWLPLLNKRKIQEITLRTLHKIQPADPRHQWMALTMYGLALAVWECLGLSTIPIETAAGMVFGWPVVTASVCGKVTGASLAFGLGRSPRIKPMIQSKLQTNSLFAILNQGDNTHGSLLTAFLMKFSCFPEFVKNFGSALLDNVTWPSFVAVSLIHGGMFSFLWIWLGVDSAFHLEQPMLEPDQGLRMAIGGAIFLGFVVSPLLMAWWIRDLQHQHKLRKSEVMRRHRYPKR